MVVTFYVSLYICMIKRLENIVSKTRFEQMSYELYVVAGQVDERKYKNEFVYLNLQNIFEEPSPDKMILLLRNQIIETDDT